MSGFFFFKDILGGIGMENMLRVEGINAKGYGTIPKIVMQDKRLTRDAKCIYAYLCASEGAGDTGILNIKKICEDLNFASEEIFKEHFKLLVECEYVEGGIF